MTVRAVPAKGLVWHHRLPYRLRREHYRSLALTAPLSGEAPLPHAPLHGGRHEHEIRRETEKLIETLRDQLLRTQADFENFRRRVRRDEQQREQLAAQRIIEQLLPVLDNLERAVATPGDRVEHLHAGVEMVYRQFLDVLAQHGVERIEAAGQPFDPNLHEAVGTVSDSGLPDNTVAAVFQPGYLIKGRLLRPAMVQVARAAG